MFNTREWAIIIWFSAFLIFTIYITLKKGQKKNFIKLFKSVVGLAKHPIMIGTITYIIVLFYILYIFNVLAGWDLIKDYFKLIIFGLFPMIYKVSTKYNNVNVFEMTFGLVKFSIIPLFIINEYTFNIFIELFLVFVITVLVTLITFVDIKAEFQAIKTPLNWTLGIIGLCIIVFAFRSFIYNIDDAKSIIFWEKMFLELLLLLHIPLLLFLQVAMYYEQIYIKLFFKLGNEAKSKFSIFWIIFKNCYFSVNKLEEAYNKITRSRVRTIQELKDILKFAA